MTEFNEEEAEPSSRNWPVRPQATQTAIAAVLIAFVMFVNKGVSKGQLRLPAISAGRRRFIHGQEWQLRQLQ